MSNAQIQTETDTSVGDVETNSPEVETALGIWRDVTQYLEEARYEANAIDLACAAIHDLNLDEQGKLGVTRTDMVRNAPYTSRPVPIKDISERLSFYRNIFHIEIDITDYRSSIIFLTLIANTIEDEYVQDIPLRVEHITIGDVTLRVLSNGSVIKVIRKNGREIFETVYTPELES